MRDSINNLNHTGESGNKNQRTIHALEGRDLDPVFDFQRIDSENVGIIGLPTGSGDTVIRVPFRLTDKDNSFVANGGQTLFISDDWIIDITTTVIDLTSDPPKGGLIDGNSLEADTDYLLWAFIDPFDSDNSKFKGFGLTKLPFTTGATVFFGGGLGALVTMTVASPDGHAFNVGARIVIRESTTKGTEYNQGIITATTATTVTATLDTTYGAISESNIALSGGGTTYEIRQLTNFVPYMYSATKELFPGSGTEYQFKYMGHIQTDTSSDILRLRYRGDPYNWAYSFATIVFDNTAIVATFSSQISLARWIPFHTRRGRFELTGNRVSGAPTTGFVILTIDGIATARDIISTSNLSVSGGFMRTADELTIRYHDISVNLFVFVPGTTTLSARITLKGYENERHF